MTRYVVADDVPWPSGRMFTAGKEYEIVKSVDEHCHRVIGDDGNQWHVRTDDCAHLEGKKWRLVGAA